MRLNSTIFDENLRASASSRSLIHRKRNPRTGALPARSRDVSRCRNGRSCSQMMLLVRTSSHDQRRAPAQQPDGSQEVAGYFPSTRCKLSSGPRPCSRDRPAVTMILLLAARANRRSVREERRSMRANAQALFLAGSVASGWGGGMSISFLPAPVYR